MRNLVSTSFVLSLAIAPLACKDKDDAPAAKSEPAAAEPAAAEQAVAEVEAPDTRSPGEKMVDWLDPDAGVVVYWDLPADVNPTSLSVVFALPSRLERMLRDMTGIDAALDAVLPLESPRPGELLGSEALGVAPLVATGTYVLRPLAAGRDEVEKALAAAEMRKTEIEGFTIYEPEPPFPWKVVFLTDEVAAFVPVKEIGTGLGPLTAGRDLPPSQLETELRRVLKEEPETMFDLYAAVPLVHFDLGQDVVQLALRMRPWQKAGLDADLRIQPSGDASEAAAALEKREAPFETDQVQALVDKVAFTVEGETVTGRLQLTADAFAALREGG